VKRVAAIFGTRPEAIKLAPVLHALAASPHFEPRVYVTAQHRSMLDPMLAQEQAGSITLVLRDEPRLSRPRKPLR